MAEHDVEPLNIDTILSKPVFNRVKKVGVELEGAWKVIPQGAKLEHDGSVFGGDPPGGHRIGEIPIKVLPAQLAGQLKKFYPALVNETCGMHIHMSFETVWHYTLLMSPEYQETVIHYLLKWAKEEGLDARHPIWSRLKNQNPFCQKKFWPDDQVQAERKDHNRERQGHRYTMIHYCWRLKTIECRVLPMMNTPELATKAIKRVLDVTNACLMTLAKTRKRKIEGKVILPGGEVYEEYVEVEVPLTPSQRRLLL